VLSAARDGRTVGRDSATCQAAEPVVNEAAREEEDRAAYDAELRQEVEELREAVSKREHAFSFEKGHRTTGRFLRVYYAQDYDAVLYQAVPEPADSSLTGKLRFLASMLKEHRFGLPVEVTGVEDHDGKTIATIDLRGEGWCRLFATSFQGTCTEITLKETFLQREYDGKWVDSVQFLYEGGSFENCLP
jgi:hypothetical protein